MGSVTKNHHDHHTNLSQYGIVLLAGGKSTRMGSEKWMLKVGEQTVLERIISVFYEACHELWIVMSAPDAKNSAKLPELLPRFSRVRICNDLESGAGPLAGLSQGLAQSSCRFNLVAASDMPFPSLRLANELFSICQNTGAMVVIPEWNGRINPLFAVYRKDCLDSLIPYIHSGGRKVMDWLKSFPVKVVPEQKVRELDSTGMALFNMNRPEDYQAALRFHAGNANDH